MANDNNQSKVKSSMENLVESFITELECHRRNISKEIEDVANTRINELNATLKRLEEVRFPSTNLTLTLHGGFT